MKRAELSAPKNGLSTGPLRVYLFMAFYDTFSVTAGDFSIALDEAGAVIASAFGDLAALKRRAGNLDLTREPAMARLAREQVLAYFAREHREFELVLAPCGTPFQQSVWAALQRIPFGQTRAYGQLAADLGNPRASRAVARANATNPICLIIPCHRVIEADGSLGGFAFGRPMKRFLLEHEGALTSRDEDPQNTRNGTPHTDQTLLSSKIRILQAATRSC